MNPSLLNINDQIFTRNNDLFIEIVSYLQEIVDDAKTNLILDKKRIGDIIIKINEIIEENRRNTETIINEINSLRDQMNQNFRELNIANQTIKYKNGKYVGQIIDGIKQGKGTMYLDAGDRYEGDYNNNKREGKGIYYCNRDPFRGERYEGDYKNDKRDGQGIYYYNNGDREMGDYSKGKRVGKHVILTKNGEVKVNYY